jgi:hypothetical protein
MEFQIIPPAFLVIGNKPSIQKERESTKVK